MSSPSNAATFPGDSSEAKRSADSADDDSARRRRLVPDGLESSGDDSVLTAPEADMSAAAKSNPAKAAAVPGDRPKAVRLVVGERSEDDSDDSARRRLVPDIFESSSGDDSVLIAAEAADAAAALGTLTPWGPLLKRT